MLMSYAKPFGVVFPHLLSVNEPDMLNIEADQNRSKLTEIDGQLAAKTEPKATDKVIRLREEMR